MSTARKTRAPDSGWVSTGSEARSSLAGTKAELNSGDQTFEGVGERRKDLGSALEKSPVEINHTEETLGSPL